MFGGFAQSDGVGAFGAPPPGGFGGFGGPGPAKKADKADIFNLPHLPYLDPDLFEQKPHHRLLCPICYGVMRHAVSIGCKGAHIFCSECIKSAMEAPAASNHGISGFGGGGGGGEGGPNCCPLDREPASNLKPEMLARSMISEMELKSCPMNCSGWTGNVEQLVSHLKDGCPNALSSCKYAPACSQFPLPKDEMKKHEQDCDYRPIACGLCDAISPGVEAAKSHVEACPQNVVPCPSSGCSERLLRCSVDNHISMHCQYAFVPCLFADQGCKEDMLRAVLESHLVSQHMVDLVEAVKFSQIIDAEGHNQPHLGGMSSKLNVYVARDEDLKQFKGGHGFATRAFIKKTVKPIAVTRNVMISTVKTLIEARYGIPVQSQRLWSFSNLSSIVKPKESKDKVSNKPTAFGASSAAFGSTGIGYGGYGGYGGPGGGYYDEEEDEEAVHQQPPGFGFGGMPPPPNGSASSSSSGTATASALIPGYPADTVQNQYISQAHPARGKDIFFYLETSSTIGSPLQPWKNGKQTLVLFKLFDPDTQSLRYIGHTLVRQNDSLQSVQPVLKKLIGISSSPSSDAENLLLFNAKKSVGSTSASAAMAMDPTYSGLAMAPNHMEYHNHPIYEMHPDYCPFTFDCSLCEQKKTITNASQKTYRCMNCPWRTCPDCFTKIKGGDASASASSKDLSSPDFIPLVDLEQTFSSLKISDHCCATLIVQLPASLSSSISALSISGSDEKGKSSSGAAASSAVPHYHSFVEYAAKHLRPITIKFTKNAKSASVPVPQSSTSFEITFSSVLVSYDEVVSAVKSKLRLKSNNNKSLHSPFGAFGGMPPPPGASSSTPASDVRLYLGSSAVWNQSESSTLLQLIGESSSDEFTLEYENLGCSAAETEGKLDIHYVFAKNDGSVDKNDTHRVWLDASNSSVSDLIEMHRKKEIQAQSFGASSSSGIFITPDSKFILVEEDEGNWHCVRIISDSEKISALDNSLVYRLEFVSSLPNHAACFDAAIHRLVEVLQVDAETLKPIANRIPKQRSGFIVVKKKNETGAALCARLVAKYQAAAGLPSVQVGYYLNKDYDCFNPITQDGDVLDSVFAHDLVQLAIHSPPSEASSSSSSSFGFGSVPPPPPPPPSSTGFSFGEPASATGFGFGSNSTGFGFASSAPHPPAALGYGGGGEESGFFGSAF